MKRPPVIVVQLVHIQGPLKGEIQEFKEFPILIGRLPSCQLQFPSDLNTISRKHAEIVRDGNQFKLMDHSANGTFVNGKRVKEVYLKDGDVLAFTEGGPKVSFLTQMKEIQDESERAPEDLRGLQKEKSMADHNEEKGLTGEVDEKREEVSVQVVRASLSIQYGPTLHSYKELPITIGKSPKCQYKLDHPAIYDQHAQVFFSENQYWIKDLTGQKVIRINGQPVGVQAPLQPNDDLALSPQGPFFQFLGGGRLAETAENPGDQSDSEKNEITGKKPSGEKSEKGILSKFKNLVKP